MDNTTPFLFVACQNGAESALKQEVARTSPDFRFAFSRPGFVTFKVPPDRRLSLDFNLQCVFARTHGFFLEKITAETAEAAAGSLWDLVADRNFQQVHIWQRDLRVPGDRGFEPGETALATTVGQMIANACPLDAPPPVNEVAAVGDRVLDCILVEPDQWWIGYHRAAHIESRWPGGVPPIKVPAEMISRAYLKMQESLMWSRLPIKPGDRCVEIGSAPGGSCQALLEKGCAVTGIDPAEMDEAVLEHEHFTYIRARGSDLKRREFRGTKWLMADSNVAPKHTLDTVEHIVTNRQVNIRGLLLTLKLPNWSSSEEIPGHLDRVRSWGYDDVRARQLAFNRQEICIAARRRR